MKSKTIKVSARVIALFAVAILISKIPEIYPDFFGDWSCQGRKYISYSEHGPDVYGPCDWGEGTHNPETHWGYQHFLFFLMGLILTIIQIIDIVTVFFINDKKQ